MDDQVYLAGDVDAVKGFVMETSSLPQIQGGSELLVECEDAIKNELRQRYGYRVIYCGGGTFLLQVPVDRADEIKGAIESLYRDRTLVATVTVVHEGQLPLADGAPGQEDLDGWARRLLRATPPPTGDGFAWRIARLQARLREAKDERRYVPSYQALPFGQRCTRCGKRTAAQERKELSERLCPVCYLRDEAGRGRRKTVHGVEVRGRFNQEFWYEHGKELAAGKRQAEDLDHLVKDAPRKYLAFLYADGNDIGRLLHGAESERHYEALSAALTEGTRAAVYRAIKDVCLPALAQLERWPFHILNIGGDDVILLLQAGFAWEVAIRFLEAFEKEVTQRANNALTEAGLGWPEGWPRPITASCAVVAADVKHPVRYMERLADDLIKQAKRLARKAGRSALTFLWLTTPVASEFATPLLEIYTDVRADCDHKQVLGRPYSLPQAQALQECVSQIARWPRSLRHRWQEGLQRGVLYSTAIVAYDIARRRDSQAVEGTISRLAGLFAKDAVGAQLSPPVWLPVQDSDTGKRVWKTSLFDALQLAELQAMRPGWREEAAE